MRKETKNYTFTKHQTIYDYYIKKLNYNSYSLANAFILSYIERFDEDGYEKYITRIKKGEKPRDVIKGLEGQFTTYDNHVKTSKDKINIILNAVDKKFSLELCFDEYSSKKSHSYVITENELMFFSYIFATKDSSDVENLLNKNYAMVSEEYFKILKFGIEILSMKRPEKITQEEINYIFDIKFGLCQRRINDSFLSLKSLVEEITTFELKKPTNQDDCNQIVKLLDDCFDSIMMMRNKIFPSNIH